MVSAFSLVVSVTSHASPARSITASCFVAEAGYAAAAGDSALRGKDIAIHETMIKLTIKRLIIKLLNLLLLIKTIFSLLHIYAFTIIS
jgi:hypothetical protein